MLYRVTWNLFSFFQIIITYHYSLGCCLVTNHCCHSKFLLVAKQQLIWRVYIVAMEAKLITNGSLRNHRNRCHRNRSCCHGHVIFFYVYKGFIYQK
ncbi:hypothetical protein BDA99DRAFT_504377 [Phascolomyces articulosus]|uniref:Uncharacterized protein n=1 Tax=Phascolomyces articulosus TaxID=60185 RepID=A0AAD5KI44_9FUNG|nr:hypothetical protein BDA99DRAFT_504377 [Phascolomyces articulosus]